MTRVCDWPGCTVLLVLLAPTKARRCREHSGLVDQETDEQRIARVCKAFGWKRTRP